MANDSKLPRSVILVYQCMIESSEEDMWRGFGSDIAKATNIKLNVVYRCIGKLEILGCIKKIRHGAAQSPSVYQLIKEPDGNDYVQMKERSIIGTLEIPSQTARVQDSITRLTNRVNDLERRLERIEKERYPGNARHDIRRSS